MWTLGELVLVLADISASKKGFNCLLWDGLVYFSITSNLINEQERNISCDLNRRNYNLLANDELIHQLTKYSQ